MGKLIQKVRSSRIKFLMLTTYAFFVLLAHASDNYFLPTEYILNYLKKSKTTWTVSTRWRQDIQKKLSINIDTAYVRTTWQEYFGVSARHLELSENGIKALFKVVRDGDMIEIDSIIEDVSIKKADDDNDRDILKEMFVQMTELESAGEEILSDRFSKCTRAVRTILGKNASALLARFTTSGKTRIPYARFMQQIN